MHTCSTRVGARRWRRLLAAAGLLVSAAAAAHDFKLGPLRIDHPYATAEAAGAGSASAYLRTLRNSGDRPDRLIGASTPAAQRVEIQRDGRAVDGIVLPPKSELRLRHDGPMRLLLIGLKAPLKDGERFAMTLRFERSGEREVMVWVQQPREVRRVVADPRH